MQSLIAHTHKSVRHWYRVRDASDTNNKLNRIAYCERISCDRVQSTHTVKFALTDNERTYDTQLELNLL